MKNNNRCSRFQFLSGLFVLSISTSFFGLLLGPWTAQAATFTWNCTTGNWANTMCWSPAGTPSNGDTAYVPAVFSAITSLTIDNTTGTAIASILFLGTSAGAEVTLQQTANTFAANSEYIGYSGAGTYNQSGGTNRVNDLYIGSTANGTYNLSSTGSLTANFNEYVGGTAGTFNQDGGTNTTSFLYLLNNSTYNLSTGSLTASFWEYVGYSGTSTFNQNGGINTVTGAANGLTLGFNSGSNGTYNQNAGINSIPHLYLGFNGDSSGTYNLNDGSLSANIERIGYGGTGIFNQNGGTNTLSGDLRIGDASYTGSSGTYNLNAGALSVGGNIAPLNSPSSGGRSIGTLAIGNGTLTVGGGNGIINVGNLVLGSIPGSNVNFTLSDTGLYQDTNKVAGALTTNNLILGKDGIGTFTQTGGSNTVSNTITLAVNAGSAGTYNLNDGALHATTITVNSGGTFNFNGGILSVNQFNGDLTNNGGTLAPGNSPGITDITGNYIQSETGIFAVEIGGTGLGQFDMLNISGTATLDGTLNVSLFDWGSGLFTPQAGDSFDILTAQMLSGQFSTYDLVALGDGLAWNISYLTDAIDTTDIVRLSVVSAVPVPPAIWLFGSGLIGLIGIARKRKFH